MSRRRRARCGSVHSRLGVQGAFDSGRTQDNRRDSKWCGMMPRGRTPYGVGRQASAGVERRSSVRSSPQSSPASVKILRGGARGRGESTREIRSHLLNMGLEPVELGGAGDCLYHVMKEVLVRHGLLRGSVSIQELRERIARFMLEKQSCAIDEEGNTLAWWVDKSHGMNIQAFAQQTAICGIDGDSTTLLAAAWAFDIGWDVLTIVDNPTRQLSCTEIHFERRPPSLRAYIAHLPESSETRGHFMGVRDIWFQNRRAEQASFVTTTSQDQERGSWASGHGASRGQSASGAASDYAGGREINKKMDVVDRASSIERPDPTRKEAERGNQRLDASWLASDSRDPGTGTSRSFKPASDGRTETATGVTAHATQDLVTHDLGSDIRREEGTTRGMTCAFWNARNLDVTQWRGSMSMEKLLWLGGRLVELSPTVLFLMEVTIDARLLHNIRRWFRIRGYMLAALEGVGGEDRRPEDDRSYANGIMVAVKKSEASIDHTVPLAERALGVVVRLKNERRLQHLACIHGLHRAVREPGDPAHSIPARSFENQIRTASSWLESNGGGLLTGDFNRVPCYKWRMSSPSGQASSHQMNPGDLEMRRVTKWNCTCCGTQSIDLGGHRLVGGVGKVLDGSDRDTRAIRPTRFVESQETSTKGLLIGTARLDVAVQLGKDEECWRQAEAVMPLAGGVGKGGDDKLLSDHQFVMVTRVFTPVGSMGEGRLGTIRFGKKKLKCMVREDYHEKVLDDGWVRQVQQDAVLAEQQGKSELEAWTRATRKAAEEAVVSAKTRAGVVKDRHGQNAHGDYQSWMRRLLKARELRRLRADPFVYGGSLLWHRKTGLAAYRERLARRGGWEAIWDGIVCRCRRQVHHAGRAHARERDRGDRRAIELALKLPADPEKARDLAFRIIRESGGGGSIEEVHVDDDPKKEKVSCFSEEGREELGKIGKLFVQRVDAGASLVGFEAWCGLFMEEWKPLEGTHGGDWRLVEEMTFPLFQETLLKMPKGKAAGAGGWHVELLIEAGARVQRLFYDAMIADLKNGHLPTNWRQVLYALLKKGPPNNPNVVQENREIALMAQDMKLFLQMVRRVSYSRLVGRLAREQAGWLAGFGSVDPATAAALVIQQARRLEHPLWLLYVDLATFFPACNRGIIKAAEILHGLPRQVVRLTALIYGTHEDPDSAVQCRYDSAGGLGAPFKNHMGALMGCVLSPDKAKILLNTVLVAIQAVAKGVRLWGFGADQQESAWRAILQLCYADDHLATFTSEAELKKAWSIWRLWAPITGCSLGVKKKLKTVVTGVRYVDGKAKSMHDPKLRRADGSYVPFARHDEAYKHLGFWRRADGVDTDSWHALRKKFFKALHRLSRLRVPRAVSINDFILISNALLGGLASYYLQGTYISWEQAEEIEERWRKIYNAKCRRARSSPRAQLYQSHAKAAGQPGAMARVHLYELGLVAIYSNFNKALGDLEDTSQRAAVLSAIALSMERWGCRSDPNRWQVGHLVEELESFLRREEVKYLGDAYLLALAVFENGPLDDPDSWERWMRGDGNRPIAARSFDPPEGRWVAGAAGEASWGPLRQDAPHFTRCNTSMLFEPDGGCGAPVRGVLLRAGIVAVGNLCGWGLKGMSGFRWLTFDEARRVNPRLPRSTEAREAWEGTVEWLTDAGHQPERPEEVRAADFYRRMLPDSVDAVEGSTRVTLNEPAVDRAVEAIEAHIAAGTTLSEEGQLEACDFKSLLAACFTGLPRPSKRTEWRHGGLDFTEAAESVRIIDVLGKGREPRARGGERRWLARDRAMDGTEEVDGDGYLKGWKGRQQALSDSVRFDRDGFPCDPQSGRRLTEDDLQGLDVAIQLECRARLRLGAVRVVRKPPKVKDNRTHVNLVTQRDNHNELCMWSARVRPTAVFATDGTRQSVKTGDGNERVVVARAAARHDGLCLGGEIAREEESDNYLAEMAALIDLFHYSPAGGRILVMMDATSPVHSLITFRRIHARKAQEKHAMRMLDTLLQLVARQEVVVFLWQRSHMGSPANEWADRCADAAAEAGQVIPVPAMPLKGVHMIGARHARGARAWALPRARRFVQDRLKQTVVDTRLAEINDIGVGLLPAEVELTLQAVRSQRYQLGDQKRFPNGWMREAASKVGCPLGCTHRNGDQVKFSWNHVAFYCRDVDLQHYRKLWSKEVEALATQLGKAGQTRQLLQMLALLRPGKYWPEAFGYRGVAGDMCIECDTDEGLQDERSVRKGAGGWFDGDGSFACTSVTSVSHARSAAIAGAQLQLMARRRVRLAEKELRELERGRALARKFGTRWRQRVLQSGPKRVAALAAASGAVRRAARWIMRVAPESEWVLHGRRLRVGARALLGQVRAECAAPASWSVSAGRKVLGDWLLAWIIRRWHVYTRDARRARARRLAMDVGRPTSERRGWAGRVRPPLESGWSRLLETELQAVASNDRAGRLAEIAMRLPRYSIELREVARPLEGRPGRPSSTGLLGGCSCMEGLPQKGAKYFQRVCKCGRIGEGVGSVLPGWRLLEQAARRAWVVMGGNAALRADRVVLRRDDRRTSMARLRGSLRRFRLGGAKTGCSGRALAPVIERIVFKRSQLKVRKRGVRRQPDPEVEGGRRADSHGRWAVDRVVRVMYDRRRQGKRGRRPLLARVIWSGRDPNTGRERGCWIHMLRPGAMSTTAKAEAQVLREALERGIAVRQARGLGGSTAKRRSARLAGEEIDLEEEKPIGDRRSGTRRRMVHSDDEEEALERGVAGRQTGGLGGTAAKRRSARLAGEKNDSDEEKPIGDRRSGTRRRVIPSDGEEEGVSPGESMSAQAPDLGRQHASQVQEEGRKARSEGKISSRLRSAQEAGIRRGQDEGAPVGDVRCGRRRRVVWSDTEDDGGGEWTAGAGGVEAGGVRRSGAKASAAHVPGGLSNLRGARRKAARQVAGAAAAARGGGRASTSPTVRMERQ